MPNDRDHFHIIEPHPNFDPLSYEDDIKSIETIPVREGMYSQVKGSPNDFEWDGWRSHD